MREDTSTGKTTEGFSYTLFTGYYKGGLPVGCRYCILGSKIIIFVTGICLDKCWYCPVSRDKLGRDVMFVDENRVNTVDDIIIEAYRVNALGAGITGGDPIYAFDRTSKIIRSLKKEFGERFHIHLYTSGLILDKNMLQELSEAGLDEIRFHAYTGKVIPKIIEALDTGISVGVEVPFIPTREYMGYLRQLIIRLNELGVEFININEFEVSESNIDNVLMHGLKPSGLTLSGIEEKLTEFLKQLKDLRLSIKIHYCTRLYKDYVQYRRRIRRKAVFTLGVNEIATVDGTLLNILVEERGLALGMMRGAIIEFNGRSYVVPSEGYLLKGRNTRAVIEERLPDRGVVVSTRSIVY